MFLLSPYLVTYRLGTDFKMLRGVKVICLKLKHLNITTNLELTLKSIIIVAVTEGMTSSPTSNICIKQKDITELISHQGI